MTQPSVSVNGSAIPRIHVSSTSVILNEAETPMRVGLIDGV
jgi:hypothetical protein